MNNFVSTSDIMSKFVLFFLFKFLRHYSKIWGDDEVG